MRRQYAARGTSPHQNHLCSRYNRHKLANLTSFTPLHGVFFLGSGTKITNRYKKEQQLLGQLFQQLLQQTTNNNNNDVSVVCAIPQYKFCHQQREEMRAGLHVDCDACASAGKKSADMRARFLKKVRNNTHTWMYPRYDTYHVFVGKDASHFTFVNYLLHMMAEVVATKCHFRVAPRVSFVSITSQTRSRCYDRHNTNLYFAATDANPQSESTAKRLVWRVCRPLPPVDDSIEYGAFVKIK